jgi:hypothetical protein
MVVVATEPDSSAEGAGCAASATAPSAFGASPLEASAPGRVCPAPWRNSSASWFGSP